MDHPLIFEFHKDLSRVNIPPKLNNPFGVSVPEIARVAAKEFQEFIAIESQKWEYDFDSQKGKMFGVLVVQKKDNTPGYLGTVSGKLPANAECDRFVPSVFDETSCDFFFTKGMTELTAIGSKIKGSKDPSQINALKEESKQKSIALQQRLFEHYHFSSLSGKAENLLEIFERSPHGRPPSAAGECAAPKLFQYAISHQLKPIALAEFWWGSPNLGNDKQHTVFYPSCKNKCRPILEFMLEDAELYEQRETV